MRRTSLSMLGLVSALLSLASCAPQAFVVNPEMRGPSKSGLNLVGKSLAVVYMTDGVYRDSIFNSFLAVGFASRLEEDYFGGEEAIESFKMPFAEGGDYSSKDSLVNLVLDTGKDVVFLFDKPIIGIPVISDPVRVVGQKLPEDSSFVSDVSIPFTIKVFVYDSMNRNDKVFAFSGSKEMKISLYSDGRSSKEDILRDVWSQTNPSAEAAGYQAAGSFLSTWKEESFYVIYYDGVETAWEEGAKSADSYQWKKAITSWMTLLKNKNAEKRACASYNIALGCFMMGQPGLALEWLDRSDQDTPVSLSKDLRTKINEYSGR